MELHHLQNRYVVVRVFLFFTKKKLFNIFSMICYSKHHVLLKTLSFSVQLLLCILERMKLLRDLAF